MIHITRDALLKSLKTSEEPKFVWWKEALVVALIILTWVLAWSVL